MQPDHSIRKCSACAVDKPLDQFERIPSIPSGRSIICKECIDFARGHGSMVRMAGNRNCDRFGTCRAHGITNRQYLELLIRQGGVCAICHEEEPGKYLMIDHDHRCCPKKGCGKCVRGLLCGRCNTAIWILDSHLLQNAIEYLRSYDGMKARKRAEKKMVPYMTMPEKDRFFEAIYNVRDKAIFRLLYHHGLRASEIGKLDMADFRQGSALHLDRIFIHRLKGSISGEVPMVEIAAQALRKWVRKRGHTDGPLFPSRQRGRITRARIWQLMRRYCAIAGIPKEKAHPHCLKHTCCTHLISDKRESIIDVQKHVGHASIKNTMIYAELMDEANEARAKRLRDWK